MIDMSGPSGGELGYWCYLVEKSSPCTELSGRRGGGEGVLVQEKRATSRVWE